MIEGNANTARKVLYTTGIEMYIVRELFYTEN